MGSLLEPHVNVLMNTQTGRVHPRADTLHLRVDRLHPPGAGIQSRAAGHIGSTLLYCHGSSRCLRPCGADKGHPVSG
jgi:hypothetical protein